MPVWDRGCLTLASFYQCWGSSIMEITEMKHDFQCAASESGRPEKAFSAWWWFVPAGVRCYILAAYWHRVAAEIDDGVSLSFQECPLPLQCQNAQSIPTFTGCSFFFFLIIPSLTSQEHRRVCFMSTLRTRPCWLRACSRENAKAILTSFQGVDWWNKWGKTPRQKKCMEIPRVNENEAARAAEREKIDGGKEVDWGWWICC